MVQQRHERDPQPDAPDQLAQEVVPAFGLRLMARTSRASREATSSRTSDRGRFCAPMGLGA